MMVQWSVLLAFVVGLVVHNVECQSCVTELCGSGVKFWIATTKNDLGDWIFETGLEHPKKDLPGWKLQVEGDSIDCSERTYCRLVTTISPVCDRKNDSKQVDYQRSNPKQDDKKKYYTKSDGYLSFSDLGRYKLYNEFATWEHARQVCESDNANLTVVDSEGEVVVMKELANQAKSGYIWVGFNDLKQKGSFVDIFGKPVLRFWDNNEPSNSGNNERCGSIKKNGLLNDFPCANKLSYICEKQQGDYQKSSDTDDYVSFSDLGRYKLYDEFATWEHARQICEMEDAHLAVVDSKSEVVVMKELAGRARSGYIYVGFSDLNKKGTFLDVFGKPVIRFWDNNEPSHSGNNEHCGTIKKNGLLNDYPCSPQLSYICEKP